mmetsp:Transcript_20127/g.60751  ORF Transcript_20127/g.60751 Transcript_20127/m.60751 type:complete len:300 (+) Transcript_20127:407-1306(+)
MQADPLWGFDSPTTCCRRCARCCRPPRTSPRTQRSWRRRWQRGASRSTRRSRGGPKHRRPAVPQTCRLWAPPPPWRSSTCPPLPWTPNPSPKLLGPRRRSRTSSSQRRQHQGTQMLIRPRSTRRLGPTVTRSSRQLASGRFPTLRSSATKIRNDPDLPNMPPPRPLENMHQTSQHLGRVSRTPAQYTCCQQTTDRPPTVLLWHLMIQRHLSHRDPTTRVSALHKATALTTAGAAGEGPRSGRWWKLVAVMGMVPHRTQQIAGRWTAREVVVGAAARAIANLASAPAGISTKVGTHILRH